MLLESAVLSSQKIIHFLFPFRFEEDAEEHRHHGQEAGAGYHGHHQPCKGGVWGERQVFFTCSSRPSHRQKILYLKLRVYFDFAGANIVTS